MNNFFALRTAGKVSVLLVAASAWLATRSAHADTVTIDFDSGTPALATGQNVPFDQSSGGLTAHFSTTTPNSGFSVQNVNSTSLTLSEFSGNYLYPNSSYGVLVIQFSQQLTNISLDFATAEQTPIENPTPVRLIAYTNSTATPPVGSMTLAGTYFGANTLPMGRLTFNSATPFNIVTLNIQPGGATGVLVDNITNQVSGGTRYTITTSASPSAGGTTTGDGTYLSGTTVTVDATANPGYMFVNWTENGSEVSTFSTYTFTADSFRTLVANFARVYTVTTSASPVAGGSTTGDGDYPEGLTITVTATANPGYAFVNWTENGVPVSTWASYPVTVSSNRTLVANFATACTITTGSSSASAGSAAGDGVYAVGATVNVIATPKTGYAFVNWTQNGAPVSTAPSYLFTANTNRTLVANFTANSRSVTYDFDTGTPALTTGQNTPFDQGAGGVTAHFSATNDPAFTVANEATGGWILTKFSGNYLTPLALDSVLDIQFSQTVTNIALTFATFDFQDIVTPTSILLTAHTNSTSTPAVGSATVAGTYSANDSVPMGAISFHSATPFNLVRITIPAVPQGATDFMVDNINVQSAAGPTYTISTSASPSYGGSTSGGGTYNNGASVTVTATANAGYVFVNWTEAGTPASTSASYTFNANAGRTLVANFAPQLASSLTSTGAVVVVWPASASAAGYVLQQNSLCATMGWVGSTNAVSVVGNQNQVVISPAIGNLFLRLFHPL